MPSNGQGESSLAKILRDVDECLEMGSASEARLRIQEVNSLELSPELQLRIHKLAVMDGDMHSARTTLDILLEKCRAEAWFREYECQLVRCVVEQRRNPLSAFFYQLAIGIQQRLLVDCAEHYEEQGELLEAARYYFVCVEAYPDTATELLPRAAELLIKFELKQQNLPLVNPIRRWFARGIYSHLLRYRIVCDGNEQVEGCSEPIFRVQTSQLLEWLEHAQAYFIALMEWDELLRISIVTMERCGYLPNGSFPLDTRHYCHFRGLIRNARPHIEDPKAIYACSMLERSVLCMYFIAEAYKYYQMIDSNTTSVGKPANTYYIVPFCNLCPRAANMTVYGEDTPPSPCSVSAPSSPALSEDELSDSEEGSSDESDSVPVYHNIGSSQKGAHVMHIANLIHKEREDCVDPLLNKSLIESSSNLEHMREIFGCSMKWAGVRENATEEMRNMFERLRLPFPLHNAALLALAEALLFRGILQPALEIFNDLFGRLTTAWHRHPQHLQPSSYNFTFRTLYCIALCYLLGGWRVAARVELSTLLTTLPFPIAAVSPELFVEDDTDIEGVVEQYYRFVRISPEKLAVRCIKHLIAGYLEELNRNASSRAASEALVLMQFGWEYYRGVSASRVLKMMRKKDLKIADYCIPFLYVPELVQALRMQGNKTLLDISGPSALEGLLEFSRRLAVEYNVKSR
ncbi:uncharacterized protein VTP21DRAFT_9235 [Calcarisporiella thermophila]|uniref:uncharacterized protein n=1 Tax=Calcarisporiella thermophila TaxID=911321 RepID=UPI003742DF2E